MDMTPGSKHNDEHDEAQKKVFRGYGFRPGGINMIFIYLYGSIDFDFACSLLIPIVLTHFNLPINERVSIFFSSTSLRLGS